MHPKDILDEAALDTGWNDVSKLAICLDFIEQMNRCQPSFQQYIRQRAKEELAEADDDSPIDDESKTEGYGK